ncbi:VOC family protein [Corynebacterium sp. Q4381]|uniref:VOC family protein n=1 Tax=Corynebacterium sp. Marseille-Q4381 TaxID=3121597 RepID=UPI002FE56473
MNRELVFIVYASDIDASVAFYRDLLGLDTDFVSPRYVTFALAEGVSLALWTGSADSLNEATARTAEVCLNVPAGEVAAMFDRWKEQGVTVLREPYEEVFGTTFVVADPDGNPVRVAPID